MHINRLKAAHDPARWEPAIRNQTRKPNPKHRADRVSEEMVELRSRPIPVASEAPAGFRRTLAPTPVVPQPAPPILDTPGSERADPSYFPPTTPNSRRDVRPTRFEPPVTRARARMLPPVVRHPQGTYNTVWVVCGTTQTIARPRLSLLLQEATCGLAPPTR